MEIGNCITGPPRESENRESGSENWELEIALLGHHNYVAISDDTSSHSDFRLKVTMVADFCSLVFLIHNTLLGEIMISSTRTTRVNKNINIIPLFPST